MSKNLDIRLRCFNSFLGNRELTEVLNQRSDVIAALFFKRKLRTSREDEFKAGTPVIF